MWVTQSSGDIVRIDSRKARIASRISAHPVYFGSAIAYGAHFVFTGNDDERYRQGTTVSKVNPSTNRIAGRPVGLGSPQSIAFGVGALWVADHCGPAGSNGSRISASPPIDTEAGGGSVWASSAGAWGGPPQPRDAA